MRAVIFRRVLPIAPVVVAIAAAVLIAYAGMAGSVQPTAAPQQASHMSTPF
jgi:hypothetical protein